MLVNFRGVVEEIHPENEVRENLNKFDLTAFRIVDGEWVKK
jgi:hypothetical protein